MDKSWSHQTHTLSLSLSVLSPDVDSAVSLLFWRWEYFRNCFAPQPGLQFPCSGHICNIAASTGSAWSKVRILILSLSFSPSISLFISQATITCSNHFQIFFHFRLIKQIKPQPGLQFPCNGHIWSIASSTGSSWPKFQIPGIQNKLCVLRFTLNLHTVNVLMTEKRGLMLLLNSILNCGVKT